MVNQLQPFIYSLQSLYPGKRPSPSANLYSHPRYTPNFPNKLLYNPSYAPTLPLRRLRLSTQSTPRQNPALLHFDHLHTVGCRLDTLQDRLLLPIPLPLPHRCDGDMSECVVYHHLFCLLSIFVAVVPPHHYCYLREGHEKLQYMNTSDQEVCCNMATWKNDIRVRRGYRFPIRYCVLLIGRCIVAPICAHSDGKAESLSMPNLYYLGEGILLGYWFHHHDCFVGRWKAAERQTVLESECQTKIVPR
mmetsp:Transcript_39607/g.69560  ORF Transcript_39607/g.69560 Transcript_39607/m.69560 type:complete len:247 (-) Transcript_39607:170-910(-)